MSVTNYIHDIWYNIYYKDAFLRNTLIDFGIDEADIYLKLSTMIQNHVYDDSSDKDIIDSILRLLRSHTTINKYNQLLYKINYVKPIVRLVQNPITTYVDFSHDALFTSAVKHILKPVSAYRADMDFNAASTPSVDTHYDLPVNVDLITINMLHQVNYKRAIKCAYNCLRVNGMLVIIDHDYNNKIDMAAYLRALNIVNDMTTYYECDIDRIKQYEYKSMGAWDMMMVAAGFTISKKISWDNSRRLYFASYRK